MNITTNNYTLVNFPRGLSTFLFRQFLPYFCYGPELYKTAIFHLQYSCRILISDEFCCLLYMYIIMANCYETCVCGVRKCAEPCRESATRIFFFHYPHGDPDMMISLYECISETIIITLVLYAYILICAPSECMVPIQLHK